MQDIHQKVFSAVETASVLGVDGYQIELDGQQGRDEQDLIHYALFIYFELVEADPISSAVIVVIILFNSIGVVRKALNILLEFAPTHIEVDEVSAELLKVDGVMEVTDLNFWTIASSMFSMNGHIVVKDQPISVCLCIVKACEDVLRERFHFSHTRLQLESSVCGLNSCVL